MHHSVFAVNVTVCTFADQSPITVIENEWLFNNLIINSQLQTVKLIWESIFLRTQDLDVAKQKPTSFY